MPRADRPAPPTEVSSPAEHPSELAARPTQPEVLEPPAEATAMPLPTVARVSPGRVLHTARGALREHELVEARFVGGAEHLAELVKSGSVYL